jgi:2-keto-4-pentenoate hydratase
VDVADDNDGPRATLSSSLSPSEVSAIAGQLLDARRSRRSRAPITDSVPLSLADAYAIQQLVTAARLERGEQVVGWKLGYTSQAMRQQMGIDSPNFGPLTDAMLLTTGSSVAPELVQPRVEPEIALRFGRRLEGEVTLEEVLAATADAVACLEVVDSVYTGYRFTLEDNTADGSSAAQVVLGDSLLALGPLDAIPVVLSRNGQSVATGTSAAASGHPAIGVVWLVHQLARRGLRLEVGDVVITGGLTAAVPLEPGDSVSAVFAGSVEISVERTLGHTGTA